MSDKAVNETRYKLFFGHDVGSTCGEQVTRVIGFSSEAEVSRLDIRGQGDAGLDECSLCRMPYTRIVRFELAHKPKV